MNPRRHRPVSTFVVVSVGLVVLSSGAAAADAHPTVGADPTVGDGALGLQIVDQSFGVSGAAPFTASIELTGSADEMADVAETVHGPTASTTSAGADTDVAEVRVRAHESLTSTDQLTAMDADGPRTLVDTVVLPAADVFTEPDSLTGTVTIAVEPGADGLTFQGLGIHPLTIEVVVDAEVVASSMTFVESFDAGAATDSVPLAVSIMAGVADPGPWPSSMELSSASIEVAKLIELAEAVDGQLSISLPPGLVTMLAASDGAPEAPGSSVPDTTESPDTTVLAGAPGNTEPAFTGIESTDVFGDAFRADELFAAPAISLDPSSLVAVEQNALFTEELRAGEDVLLQASPRAVVSRAVWYSRGPVSASAMVALRNLGIRMLMVPQSTANEIGVSTGAGSTGLFAVNLIADGTLPAMTVSDLGAQLQSPVTGDTSTTATEAAVRLLVELQLHRAATGTPAVLLATPRVTVPDPAITAQFVDLATEMPDIVVVPVSRLPGIVDRGLTDDSAVPVTLPATAGPDLAPRLARVADARIDAFHAERMLVDPQRGVGWDSDLTRVMSTAIDDATAFEHLDATHAEIERVLGAIIPPDSETLRLTGTSSTLRLRLENTYDQPLNVLIHVRSPKLRFPEPDPLVTIAAGESRHVEIPVEARSNGTFTIEVDVLAPDRAQLSGPVILKARVTRLTGLSQVFTGAAGLVLVSWWYSHIRRSRRRRQAARDPASPAADALAAVSPDAAAAMTPPTSSVLGARADADPVRPAESGRTADPG